MYNIEGDTMHERLTHDVESVEYEDKSKYAPGGDTITVTLSGDTPAEIDPSVCENDDIWEAVEAAYDGNGIESVEVLWQGGPGGNYANISDVTEAGE